MAKLVITLDGKVLKEVVLSKDRTTLGRRPYNDVVIDNLAVSGEHAVLLRETGPEGESYTIQDLGSTNGTYLNGAPIKSSPFREGDTVDIGKYSLRLLSDTRQTSFGPSRFGAQTGFGNSRFGNSRFGNSGFADSRSRASDANRSYKIKVLNGDAAGREILLSKEQTTFGQRGVLVVSVVHKPRGYELVQVEGEKRAQVNGVSLGLMPVLLRSGDVINLTGVQLQFLQV
ncbi:MAG: FHA domain-containing protein [Thiomonas sp.]